MEEKDGRKEEEEKGNKKENMEGAAIEKWSVWMVKEKTLEMRT